MSVIAQTFGRPAHRNQPIDVGLDMHDPTCPFAIVPGISNRTVLARKHWHQGQVALYAIMDCPHPAAAMRIMSNLPEFVEWQLNQTKAESTPSSKIQFLSRAKQRLENAEISPDSTEFAPRP